jgi:hypothetical protein
MLDKNPNNYDIDAVEIQDTAILWAKPIGQAADDIGVGRALAIDRTGNLWVGMFSTNQYYKVAANTGNMIPPAGNPVSTGTTHTPYGCAVDMNGKLWSVDEKNTLAEIDTTTNTLVGVYNHAAYGVNYSVSIFNDCSSSPPKVKVYLSSRVDDNGQTGKTYTVYDPQAPPGFRFSNPPPALASSCPTCLFATVAIGVDKQGNIISGQFKPTPGNNGGRVIKTSPTGTLIWDTNTAGPTQPVSDLHGIIIDANDDVWAVDLYGDQLIKYSGANGQYLKTVKVGNRPYTYSNVPPPTCSGAATPSPTPTPTPPVTPTATPCAEAEGEARCLPNGGYSYTFTVTNNSGSDMSQILLTPLQGSTFTLSPQLSNLPSPLHNGQSTTMTTIISNVKPGNNVCFFVSLMSDKAPCCTTQVCPTLPGCGEASPTPTVTSSLPPTLRQQRPPPPSRRGKRRR